MDFEHEPIRRHLGDTADSAKLVLDTFFAFDPWPTASEELVPLLNRSYYAADTAAWDANLKRKLAYLYAALDAGDFDCWAQSVEGALAYMVLCDQVPWCLMLSWPKPYATLLTALYYLAQSLVLPRSKPYASLMLPAKSLMARMP